MASVRSFVRVFALVFAVTGWLLSSSDRVTAQGTPTGLQLILQVNQQVLTTGASLRVDIGAANGATPVTADILWGLLLPDGSNVVQLTAAGLVPGSVNNLPGLRPLFSRLTVPANFAATVPNFFTYQLTGVEPAGTYRLYFAAIRPGAFGDGRIDGGDVLAVEFRDFVIGPSPTVTADSARSVSVAIGAKTGGTVQATAADGTVFSLRIPGGALLESTTVTLTPASLAGLPGPGTVLGAVRAEPSGLQFQFPATLTVTVPGGIPSGRALSALVTSGDGGFEGLPALRTGPTTARVLNVTHFSEFALVLDASFFDQTGNVVARFLPRLVAVADAAAANRIDGVTAEAQIAQIGTEWEGTLRTERPLNPALPSDRQFAHLVDRMQSAYMFDLFRQGFPGLFTGAASQDPLVLMAVTAQLGAVGLAQQLDRQCRTASDLDAAENYARTVMLGNTFVSSVFTDGAFSFWTMPPELDLSSGQLPLRCVETRITDASWPQQPPLGQAATLQVTAGLSFDGKPPVFQAGLFVDVVGQGVSPAAATGQTDAQGRFSNSFTPVNAQHRFDIKADLPRKALLLNTLPITATITRNQVQAVVVSPAQVNLQPGQSQQFTAAVPGTSNQNVTWALSGAALGSTLSATGLFTAGQTPGTVFVTATSVADPSAVGVAQVTIAPPPQVDLNGQTIVIKARFIDANGNLAGPVASSPADPLAVFVDSVSAAPPAGTFTARSTQDTLQAAGGQLSGGTVTGSVECVAGPPIAGLPGGAPNYEHALDFRVRAATTLDLTTSIARTRFGTAIMNLAGPVTAEFRSVFDGDPTGVRRFQLALTPGFYRLTTSLGGSGCGWGTDGRDDDNDGVPDLNVNLSYTADISVQFTLTPP